MKKKTVITILAFTLAAAFCLTGCGESSTPQQTAESEADADRKAADEVAALIDAIYVQERTDETDAQCKAAKEAWDALTDEQKELFEKYTDCVREHQTNTDCLIFQNGFKLGARIMLEVMEE